MGGESRGMKMSNNLVPLGDIERMAASVAKSGLFGVKQPEQAMALMLIAQAEGLHPAIAARDYHIIQGRPALKADAMLARFQTAGGKVKWTSMTDAKVSAIFSHPQGGEVEIEWTSEMVKRAGINNDMHRKYPRQMLRARCISEGIRTVFPGVVVGTYTPEEVADMEPVKASATPASVVVEQDVTDWLPPYLAAITNAQNMDELKTAFDAATKAARKAQDSTAKDMIIEAKDFRKSQLTAAPAVIDAETGEVVA